MSTPFSPGLPQVVTLTATSNVVEYRLQGLCTYMRIKCSAAVTFYFTPSNAQAGKNGLTLNAEILQAPIAANRFWVTGQGTVEVLALVPYV